MVADVEGRIEGEEKLMRVTAVRLLYRMKIPRGKRAEADRALEIHEHYCPVNLTIKQGFELTWVAEVEET